MLHLAARDLPGGARGDQASLVGEDDELRAVAGTKLDHRPADVARYLDMAQRFDLAVTSGSDFHGGNKPRIQLGRGFEGNLDVPRSVLDRLRAM